MYLKFTPQFIQEAFQRIDFKKVEPYIEDKKAIKFKKIFYKRWEVGPGSGNLSINQNLINLSSYSLALFDGDMNGSLYLNFHPKSPRLGFNCRLTQLDTELLPFAKQQNSHQKISRRSGFEIDIAKVVATGKIDITQIGSMQVMNLVNIIDPNHEDDKINQLRSMLSITAPTSINIELERGLMDLSASFTNIPLPIKIKGLEITPHIQAALADYLEIINSTPLK